MTQYVIPTAEHDISLDAELNVLGVYGIARHVLVWFVVNSMVNGADPLNDLATEIFNAIEETINATMGDTLEAKAEIDMAMVHAGILAEKAITKLVPYLDYWLARISADEKLKSPNPIQFSVTRPVGGDVIIETHPF